VTFNAELFEDGLLVTSIGMGVTVGVLVLLMFAIYGLGLFDRIMDSRQAAAAVLNAPTAGSVTAVSESTSIDAVPGGEIVAAIAAALALAENDAQTTQILNSPPAGTSADAWATAGRRHLMNQRGRPSR